jgi:hypothetical protein
MYTNFCLWLIRENLFRNVSSVFNSRSSSISAYNGKQGQPLYNKLQLRTYLARTDSSLSKKSAVRKLSAATAGIQQFFRE